MKFLKVGRVAIITRGRYAGKKVRFNPRRVEIARRKRLSAVEKKKGSRVDRVSKEESSPARSQRKTGLPRTQDGIEALIAPGTYFFACFQRCEYANDFLISGEEKG